MAGQISVIKSKEGAFDCYVAMPGGGDQVPAIVFGPSAFGLNDDIKKMCDDLAAQGYIAAAPDNFWRGDKGPIPMNPDGFKRALARIEGPEIFEGTKRDIDTTLKEMRKHPRCNGKTAVIGLCYGGPFAVLGVTELGCDAGASYHGGGFEHQLDNMKKVDKPLSLHWGDEDFSLPADLMEQVKSISSTNKNVQVFIYPGGVKHGYTGPSAAAWDAKAAGLTWERVMPVLDKLKSPKKAA